MTNSYKVTDTVDAGDFFCGGGGASQGLHKAGVDLRFAANHDAVAIATHTANAVEFANAILAEANKKETSDDPSRG